jgi:hypothetical protein
MDSYAFFSSNFEPPDWKLHNPYCHNKGEASFDTPFMIQSRTNTKACWKYERNRGNPLGSTEHSQSSHNCVNWARLAVAPTISFIFSAWLCIINGVLKLAQPLPSNCLCLFLMVIFESITGSLTGSFKIPLK